jgi:hypothetical protein
MGLVQHEGGPCGVLATIQVIPRFLIMLFFLFLLVCLINFYIMRVLWTSQGFFFFFFVLWELEPGGVDVVPKWIVDHGILLKK